MSTGDADVAGTGTGLDAHDGDPLVDRQTGEKSPAMGWGECMERHGASIKATGAQSLREHSQAGARYPCEVVQ
jgi:hypothetical protein